MSPRLILRSKKDQVTQFVICSKHFLHLSLDYLFLATYAYLMLFCIFYGMLKGFDVHTPDEDSSP